MFIVYDSVCAHTNVRWVSGEVGVSITLNPYDVVCDDCGEVALVRGDE